MTDADRPVTIFLSAAEASGDEHAAKLIRAIQRRRPGTRFVGVAGPEMAAAGCEVLADLTQKASMLGGPLLRLGYYYRTLRRLRRQIAEIRPDLHIPVDSPALNWHLAAAARQAGAKVLYYIAPQVWAWASWRVKKLARLTDAVACILPFEQDYLRRHGVNATFVGHPIYDLCPSRPSPLPNLADAWYAGTWRVALLPGSRPSEIHGHVPGLAALAEAIARRWPKARCTFAALNQEAAEGIRAQCRRAGRGEPEIVTGKNAAIEVLSQATFAAVGSGTVTLQAAYLGVPMVVFYRTGRMMRVLYHTLGRRMGILNTTHLSLVNILAGRRIMPELMPWRGDISRLVNACLEAMQDLGYLHELRKAELQAISPLCLPPPATASDNAADMAVGLLAR